MSKKKNLYWLSDLEWAAIEPHLPRGVAGRAGAIISGIVHMLRSGARWRIAPPATVLTPRSILLDRGGAMC